VIAKGLFAPLVILAPGLALAEEMICTPTFYINGWEPTPFVIPVDASLRTTARKISVDVETGAWHENFVEGESKDLRSGTFTIVNKGSLRERIDFIAIDTDTGTVLHIALYDADQPFVLTDHEGSISTGRCVFGYDQ
jgi:hypothetical protein